MKSKASTKSMVRKLKPTFLNRTTPVRMTPARLRKIASVPDLSRHILTYDSEDPTTFSAHTLPPAAIMQAVARSPIPWPAGQAPVPQPMAATPSPDAPLPQADYVVVTWTVEEAKALADTLTPGYPSKTAWYDYTHNFTTEYVPIIRKGAPALSSKRLASYFLTEIAGKKVLCMKSELHLSQDACSQALGPDHRRGAARADPDHGHRGRHWRRHRTGRCCQCSAGAL